jgi:regulator of PEP synthase PpsR (kinase-PPPase family)
MSDNQKVVYIISDGTGQSAINILKASLIQFDGIKPVLRVFSKVDNMEKLQDILSKAKDEEAFVSFTIAKHEMREFAHKYCHDNHLIHHDILGPPVKKLSRFLNCEPKELSNLLRRVDERYFRRIHAIEFSINNDDGKNVKKVFDADIVILGLSRTSKTPTSFFLAQQGYKVVNIPLVPNVPVPEEVFKIDQKKVVCLIMDPEVLQKVRMARLKQYKTQKSTYIELKNIIDEVEMVYDLIKKNRQWNIVDTTNKSIEETAREIISLVYGHEVSF